MNIFYPWIGFAITMAIGLCIVIGVKLYARYFVFMSSLTAKFLTWCFKFMYKFYENYFMVFTENSNNNPTENNPQFTIYWYRGVKRRKLIGTQYTN